jgi:hypothetical protein
MGEMSALDLVAIGLKYDGERVTAAGDLPTDVDELLALSQALGVIARVASRIRVEVDEEAASVIGPGRPYRYGDHIVTWRHGYKWRPYDAATKFILDVARALPEGILDLFSPAAMRKTGIEKVARKMGLDPELVITTVLAKEWEDSPRLIWKWQPEIEGEQHERRDDRSD